MTVGEMVEERIGYSADCDVDVSEWRELLRSLGIWDAEVLEWHVGADFPLFDDMTEAFGKTLRIIVLPAKGE